MPRAGLSQQHLWFYILYKIGSALGAVALLTLGFIWVAVKLVSSKEANSIYGLIHSTKTQKLDSWIICSSLLSSSFMWVLHPIVRSVISMKTIRISALIVLIIIKLLACFFIVGMLAFYCVLIKELELDIQINAIYIFIGLLILILTVVLAGTSFWLGLRYLRKILGGYRIVPFEPGKRIPIWFRIRRYLRVHLYPVVISINLISAFCFTIVFSPIFANILPFYHVTSTLLSNNIGTSIIVSVGGYVSYAPANSPLGIELASVILDTPFTLDCTLTGDLILAATNCYDVSKCVTSDSLESAMEMEGHEHDYGFSGMASSYDILTFSSSQVTSLNTGLKYLELDPFGSIAPLLIDTPNKAYASEITGIENSYIETLKAQNMSLFIDTLLLGLSIAPYTLVRLWDRPNIGYFSNHSEHIPHVNEASLQIPYAHILGTSFINLMRTLSTMTSSQLDSCGVLINNPITFHKIASYINLTHPHMKLLIPAKSMVISSLASMWLPSPVEKTAIAGVYCTFHSASYCVKAALAASNRSSFETHFLYANSFLMMITAVLINAQYIHTEYHTVYGPDATFIVNSILFFNLRVGLILYICIYCLLFCASLAIMCYSEILLKR